MEERCQEKWPIVKKEILRFVKYTWLRATPQVDQLNKPEIEKLSNVTVYTFLYPIEGLHPQAIPTSKQIWCEKDRLKAWKAYMLRGERPKASGECANPVDDVIALGNKLRVSGTPTLIFENGQRVPGYVPADKLDQLLTVASKK